MTKEDPPKTCPVCGGTGQGSFSKDVNRFLLSTEECYECAGTGCQLDSENERAENPDSTGKTFRKKPEPVRGITTILVVDDNPAVRKMILDALEPLGYKVLIAASGQEALEICGMKKEKIDLLLTDIVMPVINGRQLIKKLQSVRPNLQVLLMSGYPEDVVGPNNMLEPNLNFISKPFVTGTLVQKINQVLEESSRAAGDD